MSWHTHTQYKPDTSRTKQKAKPPAKPQTPAPYYAQQTTYPTQPAPAYPAQQYAAYTTPPIPTATQALHTSYASRLRTGATLIMQPILTSATTTSLRNSSRRAGLINYTEPGSGDELDGPMESDDSDFVASGGTKAAVRSSLRQRGMGGHGSSASGTPVPGSSVLPGQSSGKGDLDQAYAGPSKNIIPKPAHLTKHEFFSQEALDAQAAKPSNLVPIRVELETDQYRIRDCFVWNVNEQLITPQQFAKIFCADLELPVHPYVEQVTAAIRSQVEEHEGIASMDLSVDPDDEGSAEGDELPDCRVILAIDVQIGTRHLMDTIEWDLSSSLTPENFALTLCADLGLTGEAAPLVAHAVHEELLKHKRDAVEWGIIGGDREEPSAMDRTSTAVTDSQERERARDKSGLGLLKDKTGLGLGVGGFTGRAGRDAASRAPKTLRGVWRDWGEAEEWRTRFEELTPEEVERREIERERASRRLRRETSKFQSSNIGRRRR
ncbi:SNF5-domain-containing protein [Sistotremastrum suecicum HHB10207 ss-3]|nr:SNF5-domain-containing protein [Sistotremastrum suecicum HHB10207 ss-3]